MESPAPPSLCSAHSSSRGRDGTTELADMMHVLTGIHTTHNTKLSPEEVTDIMAELRIPRGEAISVRDFVKAMSSGFVQFTEE